MKKLIIALVFVLLSLTICQKDNTLEGELSSQLQSIYDYFWGKVQFPDKNGQKGRRPHPPGPPRNDSNGTRPHPPGPRPPVPPRNDSNGTRPHPPGTRPPFPPENETF